MSVSIPIRKVHPFKLFRRRTTAIARYIGIKADQNRSILGIRDAQELEGEVEGRAEN